MKFTAASSYDYMKLIVMELQQKLVEQEELEKLQAQQQLRSKNLLILTDKALKSVKKELFHSNIKKFHSKWGLRENLEYQCLLVTAFMSKAYGKIVKIPT